MDASGAHIALVQTIIVCKFAFLKLILSEFLERFGDRRSLFLTREHFLNRRLQILCGHF